MTNRVSLSLAFVVAAAALFASTATASCVLTTAADQRARAAVIFDGVALDGPTATGIQRFRVIRFLKGRGPGVVRVQTGNKRTSVTSVSIVVRRGERWRIFAQGAARNVLRTSVCDGSRRL